MTKPEPAITPPPPLMLVMLPPDIAQQLYALMVQSDQRLADDLAAIRAKYAAQAQPSRRTTTPRASRTQPKAAA
jgi:hypothetical protein